MNKINYFIKKNSGIILAGIAGAGVILTTVLSAKATVKAVEKINEEEQKINRKLTNKEKIKVCYKYYIYTGLSAIGTISSIFGLGYINKKQEISFVSAYSLLENSYNQYQNNIREIAGNDIDNLAKQEIIKAKYDQSEELDLNEDEELFFDYQGARFFKSTFKHVEEAGKKYLEALNVRGYACLNEYYDCLGIPKVDYGYDLGWFDIESCDPYNVENLEFKYSRMQLGKNQEISCWVIETNYPPSFDYII